MSYYDRPNLDDLAAAYTDTLRRTGQVIVGYYDEDERDLIRSAGREAGRILGRPVRASDRDGKVVIVLADWGDTNPLEKQLSDARARNAIDRALRDAQG